MNKMNIKMKKIKIMNKIQFPIHKSTLDKSLTTKNKTQQAATSYLKLGEIIKCCRLNKINRKTNQMK
jgi:UDP-glucose 6-dehydrogenase